MGQLNLLCFLLFISLRVISMPFIGCGDHPIAHADAKVRVSNLSINLYQIGILSSELTLEESQEDDSEHKLLPFSTTCSIVRFSCLTCFSCGKLSHLSCQAFANMKKRLFIRFQNLRI